MGGEKNKEVLCKGQQNQSLQEGKKISWKLLDLFCWLVTFEVGKISLADVIQKWRRERGNTWNFEVEEGKEGNCYIVLKGAHFKITRVVVAVVVVVSPFPGTYLIYLVYNYSLFLLYNLRLLLLSSTQTIDLSLMLCIHKHIFSFHIYTIISFLSFSLVFMHMKL